MFLERFATKEDILKYQLETKEEISNIKTDMGNMAWKMAGLLILQAGVIVALIKLI